ncbi:dicarboxylate transporter/tellurite-resistance protein TehA [soil metagenome]
MRRRDICLPRREPMTHHALPYHFQLEQPSLSSSTISSATSAHTATSPALRPWLSRLSPGLFGIPLGVLALSASWQRLGAFGWAYSAALAQGLLWLGLALLALLLALTGAKLLRHGAVFRQEFNHPVQGALLALMPVACLVAVLLLWPDHPDWHVAVSVVVALCLLLQAALAWHIVSQLATGQMPAELLSPALYVPIVPGGFVGAMALHALGLPGFAMLLMGMGLGGWALLEMRILNRLFAGPLAPGLRPTLGIEIAPAAVGTLAVAALWPNLPADFIMIGLGIASGPALAVMTRWRWWIATPFSSGFWSFSFPVAVLASCVTEAVRRGGWPPAVALAAVLLASALVVFLVLRTLILLVQGRLLPRA